MEKSDANSPAISVSPPVNANEPEKLKTVPNKWRWRQYYASFAANLGAFSFGAVWSWTATALPSLKDDGSLGEISQQQEAWITSIIFIGAMISSPLTGFIMDKYGRRFSILLVTPVLIGGWLLIAFAQNIPMIYVGRFITGICAGCLGTLAPVYIAETAEKDIRGMLICGFDPALAAGILYIYIIGSYTSWTNQALACLISPVTSHILLMFCAESPRYLIAKEQFEEGKKCLEWFRVGNSETEIKEELQQIMDMAEETQNAAKNGSGKSTWRTLLQRSVWKPTLIGMGLFFFHQATGNYAILAFTVDIFRSTGRGLTDEYMSTTIVGAAQMVGALLPLFLVERCGRRILLILSEAISTITLLILGIFFYLKSSYGSEFVEQYLYWLPLIVLIIYEIAFGFGIGPIPFLLMGEIAPPNAKGISTTLMAITVRTMGFVILYNFNQLMGVFGFDVGYWFFSFMCLLGTIFVYLWIPETKGKTLEEIHDFFSKSKILVEKL